MPAGTNLETGPHATLVMRSAAPIRTGVAALLSANQPLRLVQRVFNNDQTKEYGPHILFTTAVVLPENFMDRRDAIDFFVAPHERHISVTKNLRRHDASRWMKNWSAGDLMTMWL